MSQDKPTTTTSEYIAYANAAVRATITAETDTEARKQFCSAGDNYTLPLSPHVEGAVEIDRGIDIEAVETNSDGSPTPNSTEQQVDPHSADPTIKGLTTLLTEYIEDDDYSLAKMDGGVSIQLHHDEQTAEIVAALTQSNYSFQVSQAFETPPYIGVYNVIDADEL